MNSYLDSSCLSLISPCITGKIYFACKKAAKKELGRIKSTAKNNDHIPCRSYKCDVCEGYHLTAQPNHKFKGKEQW